MEEGLFSESDLDEETIKAEREELDRKKEEEEKRREEEKLKLEEEERKREEEEKKKEEEENKKVFDKQLYIIDGYGLIYKGYYAYIKRPILDKNGNNLSAYYGFFQSFFSIISKYEMDYLAIAMDEKGPTFRHLIYPEYKATREKTAEDLHASIPAIIDTLNKMNIHPISKQGFEADDVIASITKVAYKEGIDSVIVSGDKDLCQLVNKHVKVLSPPKKNRKEYELLDADGVKKEYGVWPNQIIDYLSIVGDGIDNIPGVENIGEVGAREYLENFKTLEGIYAHINEIKQPKKREYLEKGKESAFFSKELITLHFDALDENFSIKDLDVKFIEKAKAGYDFEERGFKALARRAFAGSKHKVKEKKLNTSSTVVSQLTEVEKETLLGNGEYIELKDKIEVEEALEKAVSNNEKLALFILTEKEDQDDIISISFSSELKKAYYIKISETFTKSDFIEISNLYFKSGKLSLILDNAKEVIKLLWSLKTDIKDFSFDTSIASWLLDSNSNKYTVQNQAVKYLNQSLIDVDDLVQKKEKLRSASEIVLFRFTSENADYILRLTKVLERLLEEKNLNEVYYSEELPLVRILAKMEEDGIYLSSEKLIKVKETTDSRIEKLQDEIYKIAGEKFNINSPMQLGKILFEKLELKSGKTTQRGFSTDITTLESLKDDSPIIPLLIEYKGLNKLKSTYIDALPTLRDKNGAIHTTFLQTGTATGRLSSRNPNLQNIPVRTDDGRLIRSAFVPRDGKIFLSADYSQIELVVLAYMSNDPELTEAFNTGADIHKFIASRIFNKELNEVSPEERRIAKTINFGIMYGMSAFRLANELSISKSSAADFISRYFERYKGVKDFVEKTLEEARKNGYVRTEFGHVREIIGINSVNKTEKSAAERVAINTVIQGTAAEILKRAMINISNAMSERNFKSKLLLTVHDELIFEVERSEMDELYNLVKTLMEGSAKLTVPLRVSLEWGECWGDIH